MSKQPDPQTTPDCRVVGCFFERNKSRTGLLPCEQGFGGTPELCEATFRHCALRIQAAYETILTDEIKKERFQMTNKPVATPITFGKIIRLPDGDMSISGCASLEDADWKVRECARACGYRPPPRWRFWNQKTWVKA